MQGKCFDVGDLVEGPYNFLGKVKKVRRRRNKQAEVTCFLIDKDISEKPFTNIERIFFEEELKKISN